MRQQVNLGAYQNKEYEPGAGLVKRILWYCVNALFFNHAFALFAPLKVGLLRLFGAKVGKGLIIKQSVNIKYPWFLSIGDHVWIGENVWIDNLTTITIGDHVCISQGAMLLTGNHNYKKTSFDLLTGKIVLEDGVWIGAQSVVCPNVTCHSHAILTVNSTAVGNLEAYMIYQGNPAEKVKERVIK